MRIRFSATKYSLSLLLVELLLIFLIELDTWIFIKASLSIMLIFILPGAVLLPMIKKEEMNFVSFLLYSTFTSICVGIILNLMTGFIFHKLIREILLMLLVTISIAVFLKNIRSRNFVKIQIEKYDVLCILVAVIYYFVWSNIALNRNYAISPDEARYFSSSLNLIKRFSFSPYPSYPIAPHEISTADIGGAIGYFNNVWILLVSLFFLISKTNIFSLQVFGVFISSLLLLSTFILGSIVYNKKVGFISLILIGINPALNSLNNIRILPNVCSALFTTVAYYFFINGIISGKIQLHSIFTSILFLVLALFTHKSSGPVVTIIIGLCFFVMLLNYKNKKLINKGLKEKILITLILTLFIVFSFFITQNISFHLSIAKNLTFDFTKIISYLYSNFLYPLYFTYPIIFLFIQGFVISLLHFAKFQEKLIKGIISLTFDRISINLLITMLSIILQSVVLAIFQNVSSGIRHFYVIFPMILIVSAYGLTNIPYNTKSRLIFLTMITSYLAFITLVRSIQPNAYLPLIGWSSEFLSYEKFSLCLAFIITYLGLVPQIKTTTHSTPMPKKLSALILCLLIVSSSFQIYIFLERSPWFSPSFVSSLLEASRWMFSHVNNTNTYTIIMTNAKFRFGAYVENKMLVFPPPPNETEFIKIISQRLVDYIIIFTSYPLHRFWEYPYLKKYTESPPPWTEEAYRSNRKNGETSFVIYRCKGAPFHLPNGVNANISSNGLSLTNGYIKLDVTKSHLMFSRALEVNFYKKIFCLNFNETAIEKDNEIIQTLGKWDRIYLYDYQKTEWISLEDNQIPNEPTYHQKTIIRIDWEKAFGNVSVVIALERGKDYVQTKWTLKFGVEGVWRIKPCIKLMEIKKYLSFPGNLHSWSQENASLYGNPWEAMKFGVGYVLSHNPNIKLLNANRTYEGSDMPSSIVHSSNWILTSRGNYLQLQFDFYLKNIHEQDQWTFIEVFAPDGLLDNDEDGFYNAILASFNIKENTWSACMAWDSRDDKPGIGAWGDSRRIFLLNGTRLSEVFGYPPKAGLGVGVYNVSNGGDQSKELISLWTTVDAPSQMTYSEKGGCIKRLGFAVRLPGEKGNRDRGNEVLFRLIIRFKKNETATYEFQNSNDEYYGLQNLNDTYFYFFNEKNGFSGFSINKRPSKLTVSASYDAYKRVVIEYETNSSMIDFYLNPFALNYVDQNDLSDLARATMAYINYSFSNIDSKYLLLLNKTAVVNDFNSTPAYTVALDPRWSLETDISTRIIRDNKYETVVMVDDINEIEIYDLPRAITTQNIEQMYDASNKRLDIVINGSGLRQILIYLASQKVRLIYTDTNLPVRYKNLEDDILVVTLIDLHEVHIQIYFK